MQIDIPQPLSGVRVLDLGQIYQGPYATFLLASWGADLAILNSDFSQPPLEPAGGAVGVQGDQAFNVGSQGGTDLLRGQRLIEQENLRFCDQRTR